MNYYELMTLGRELAEKSGLLTGDSEKDKVIRKFLNDFSFAAEEQFKSALLDSDFGKGAKAVFDSIQMRAANHWHGNPKIDAQCQQENKLVCEWVQEAFEEVSPSGCAEWLKIGELLKENQSLKTRIKDLEVKD